MKIKQTKTGQVSLKMDEEMWQVILMAFQRWIDADWAIMEAYECALAREIASKLWQRYQTGDLSLKLRRSEFHFIFCKAVMCFVHESHHAQINLATEAFKRQTVNFKAVAIERL
jgi:hypothetical protein